MSELVFSEKVGDYIKVDGVCYTYNGTTSSPVTNVPGDVYGSYIGCEACINESSSSSSLSSSSSSSSSLSNSSSSSISSSSFSSSLSNSSSSSSSSSSSLSSSSSSSPVAVNPCSDPEILITVTGASGTINWAGQTWNLPGDSGVTKSVCPNSYSLFTGVKGYDSLGTYYRYGERWFYSNSLQLARNYNPQLNVAGTKWYRNGYLIPTQIERIRVKNGHDFRYNQNTVGDPTRPVSWVRAVIGPYVDLGILGNTPWTYIYPPMPASLAPIPYATNYRIPDEYFGSYVSGGITYTWARGAGW